MLSNFHARLLTEVEAGKMKAVTAKGVLGTVKSFVRWLWQAERLENLPRNLDTLRISADCPTITTYTPEEIQTLLRTATERTRLYGLLMLNTGMSSRDISELKPAEVDWKEGRIIRKRSKTRKQKTAPTVNYKLWPQTFDLLKKYRQKGERVILSITGQPLRRWEEANAGKTRNLDTVGRAWERLAVKSGIRKSAKLLRKTSASKLAEHPTYGRFSALFLGHSPKTTAEIHYQQLPQALFDEAIDWLGKQFGIS